MADYHHLVRVDFKHFKAFANFVLHLRHFNILVGPNNAGKSTILTAFRILAAAMRKAATRRPEIVTGPHGSTHGYSIDLSAISVAEENIFFNYDDSEPASVTFTLSNRHTLLLFFPEQRVCNLILDTQARPILNPSTFKSHFRCPVGFVPILGPVEHNEPLYEKEAARLALFSYRAARNFRNIWYHYPDKFDAFRTALKQTWPGMDIEPPLVDTSHQKPLLRMFCPEDRIPREIFWAGFGFQVWCQMLTHLIQSTDSALFLIDEPDIYLHSDLQRQLLGILRNMGPDILIATHSLEIITEAETDDIVIINKRQKIAKRIHDPSQLEQVFKILGSNLNPILTQLAKARRAVFVEGKDFQIIGRFARKLGFPKVANRSDFAIVPVEGFNPERIRNLKVGIEATLGGNIGALAVLDRDYRSDAERATIGLSCGAFCDQVTIHKRKEIENFLLVPTAIDRAAARRLEDQNRRSGDQVEYACNAEALLTDFCAERKAFVMAQYLAKRRQFERANSPTVHESVINEIALKEFEANWGSITSRLQMVPGKEALSAVNIHLQEKYGINITATAIIDSMASDEVPDEMRALVERLSEFSTLRVK
jgi:energy-coupling factor transporter ATP-binding protein EcfA2